MSVGWLYSYSHISDFVSLTREVVIAASCSRSTRFETSLAATGVAGDVLTKTVRAASQGVQNSDPSLSAAPQSVHTVVGKSTTSGLLVEKAFCRLICPVRTTLPIIMLVHLHSVCVLYAF